MWTVMKDNWVEKYDGRVLLANQARLQACIFLKHSIVMHVFGSKVLIFACGSVMQFSSPSTAQFAMRSLKHTFQITESMIILTSVSAGFRVHIALPPHSW